MQQRDNANQVAAVDDYPVTTAGVAKQGRSLTSFDVVRIRVVSWAVAPWQLRLHFSSNEHLMPDLQGRSITGAPASGGQMIACRGQMPAISGSRESPCAAAHVLAFAAKPVGAIGWRGSAEPTQWVVREATLSSGTEVL